MKKILVIEDEHAIRLNILDILEMEDFESIGADDGREGVAMAKKHLPDLIICDILMPKLNGYGVLAELRSDPKTATIPFIFLTAKTTPKDIREGMNLGADDYLTKPFEVDELIKAVHTRLEKHAALKKQLEKTEFQPTFVLPEELRASLNVVAEFADSLANPDMLKDQEAFLAMGKTFRESVDRLRRQIEKYLLYAELQMAQHDPEKKNVWTHTGNVNTKSFISLFANYQAREAKRQDDLTLELVEAGIQASSRVLQKLIIELLDNAFKFSEPGTPVRLAAMKNVDQFSLTITDNGRGMEKEQVTDINAYMQGETPGQYEQKYSGLGLVISRLLIQLQNIQLTIDSKVNQGTTVTVVFPGY